MAGGIGIAGKLAQVADDLDAGGDGGVGGVGGEGPDPGLGAQMAPPTGKSVMFFSSGRQGPVYGLP